jgi:RNA polymerase sigma-70 factor, ECF subfamily
VSAPTDELTRLLVAAAHGDRAALAGFVRATQADVWRFCAHLVDPASADDLTQEVYARALAAVDRFRADASARTWLLSIARNTAADEIRRRQRHRRLFPATATTPGGDDVLASRATEPVPALPAGTSPEGGAIELATLVRALDGDRREAFVLTQVVGLTYAEAAETCGVPVGTIRSRVARAREELVTALQDDANDATTRSRRSGA